jgi:hypothetical protein
MVGLLLGLLLGLLPMVGHAQRPLYRSAPSRRMLGLPPGPYPNMVGIPEPEPEPEPPLFVWRGPEQGGWPRLYDQPASCVAWLRSPSCGRVCCPAVLCVMDACGICGGDGSSCVDCANTTGGAARLDRCDTCDADLSNDCVLDCSGVWGGLAIRDDCGVCDGGGVSCRGKLARALCLLAWLPTGRTLLPGRGCGALRLPGNAGGIAGCRPLWSVQRRSSRRLPG